ncbi:MAG: response regulator transcription factor [Myxococcota bacterium]
MKLLVCDDHPLFREGLLGVLRDMAPEAELLQSGSAEDASETVARQDDIDLVLLDIELPGANGLDTLARWRGEHPTVPVAIVSASEDPADVRAALDAGASGFIPKSSSGAVLRSALQLIFSGGLYVPPQALDGSGALRPGRARAGGGSGPLPLTPRQIEVARLLAKGLTNREICGVLTIAEGTVKAHIAAIFEALEVTNRTEAATVLRDYDDFEV